MRKRFCLNSATIRKTPLEEQIWLASEAGFPRVGLWFDDIEAATSRGVSLDEIAGWVKRAKLKVEELCFLGGWQSVEEGQFPLVLQRTRHLCRVSRALDCDIVVAVPPLNPGSLAGAPACLREVCRAAAEFSVQIALEFPGTAAEVKDLATAWQVVSLAGCENAGLVLDSFHFFLGGSRIDDLAGIPGEKIFLVHLSDAMDVPLEKLRRPHDFRTFPGEGTLEYGPLLRALQDIGYQGAFSLEIWNQRLNETDPAEVARKGFESLLGLEQLVSSPATTK
ncbi:MAG: sugar phosphate isomerase/epimerase [Terriglobia bacterium]|jgi:4-hydroxyphenylpyruvate dioxygenase